MKTYIDCKDTGFKSAFSETSMDGDKAIITITLELSDEQVQEMQATAREIAARYVKIDGLIGYLEDAKTKANELRKSLPTIYSSLEISPSLPSFPSVQNPVPSA